MADSSLPLTAEERQFLIEHLETHLTQTRLEEHRSDSHRFREHVHEAVEIVEPLRAKLRAVPT